MRKALLSSFLFLSLSMTGLAADAPIKALPLQDAIRMAIETNLSSKLARAATDEARGQAIQAAAFLLPRITATASQARVFKVNLEASGFKGGPIPTLVGPFNSFDARFALVQNLLDLTAFYRYRAGRAGERIADLREKLAREQVAASAALAYFEAQRAARAVAAAESTLKVAESLFKLARDQREAGVSTGVDVARAETNAAQERLRVIRAKIDADAAQLRLKRVTGLPFNQALRLEELPRQVSPTLPAVDRSVDQALQERLEIQIAKATVEANDALLAASKSQSLPTLRANADYGFSGTDPSNNARTGRIGGAIEAPIWSGGSNRGARAIARAQRDEAEDRLNDVRSQIEEDVRLALQTLTSAVEETRTADQAVALAQKELTMARDRFAAGVGDNIQVISAEAAADRALDDQVNALARYDTARVNLALAQGRMQTFQP